MFGFTSIMKSIVLVLCTYLTLCNASEIELKFNMHVEECTSELYGDQVEVKYFKHRYLPENNGMVDNIVECSWKKDGLINEKGEIEFENLKKLLINEFRRVGRCSYYLALLVSGDVYDNCKSMLGESTREIAVKITNCVLRRIDSYY